MHKSYGLNELRELFLAFFETKSHLRLPSFPLIPQNDPSLLLINSGMAPMKPWFTGEEEPPRTRVCTCQKCIRTGDIENIGHTARHGTFFEMLGNFSFGDYFKEEAIAWSWEFLTSPEWVGLEADRLYPSVYEGDNESFLLWRDKMGIAEDRIFHFGKADNFWEHGSGPCGPCSEIYYDRGEKWGCGSPDCTVGCECDRYIEVWNNVFTQFNSDGAGTYTDLSQKNIDTGMGLERLACVSQEVASLFDVDTVMRITNKVSEITSAHYGESKSRDVSLRVITDHIRSATFMICDGVLPSNEGRGYVLRRLLRRAARHGKLLGVNEPFLFTVCPIVVEENGGHYPELAEKADYITRIIKIEEENFAKTIDGGIRIFTEMLAVHKAEGLAVFSGADAFKLYDTYGFPIDLTIEMVEEEAMTVDTDGFKALMEEQKVRARKARAAMGDLGWSGIEFGKDMPSTAFVGYDSLTTTAKVLALVVEEELSERAASGVDAIVVLDQTTLYAEMGGQVADHGTITTQTATFQVTDVQKNKGGKYMHYGKVIAGELKIADTVTVTVEKNRRRAISRAHSATHLLHKALQTVLGEHVHQAGSLVEPDRLRFDFAHFSALTTEELAQVSAMVNNAVLEGYLVDTQEMAIDEAKAKGATALFGEKYGDSVRVVDMGEGYSSELCGGTHVDNSAKVGVFHVGSEFSVASGVRRIEATTGQVSLDNMQKNQEVLFQASAVLKTKPADLRNKAEQTMEEMKGLRHMIEAFRSKEAVGEAKQYLMGAKNVGDLKVLTATFNEGGADHLRKVGDHLRSTDPNVVAVLSYVENDKISFLCVCGKDAIAQGVKAGDIIKAITPICGGKGGGKPDSAMGGGSNVLKLDDALASVDDFVAEKLGL